MLLRLFTAFCVATVLAQSVILGMSAVRGNLKQETILRAVALLNGVDISGDRLKQMLIESRQLPNPTYEEVEAERARQNSNLDMRERSINMAQQQTEEMLKQLRSEIASFEARKEEFHTRLKEAEEKLLEENLVEVQRTLESLLPEQAKDQLKKLIEAGQMEDVVAIVKGMQLDKRKKVLGEFVEPEEVDQLHKILSTLREGEPKARLIQNAREPDQID